MAYSQLLFSRSSAPVAPQPPRPQLSRRSPSCSPPTRCCDNGRPITIDTHTGQTICSCQYPANLVAFPRVPGLPEGVYGPGLGPHPSVVPLAADASAFYSPLANVPYDLKENAEAWRSLQQTGNCIAYDPAMGFYPYPGYSGLDLNGARRKNATRETTTTLKHWLYEHRKNPYPTKGEKIMLAIITKMTLTQVSTWFANARRRLKKENKMTWTPRNRADEGMESGNNDESDVDIDDDLDEEDKEKLQRAGLLSPTGDNKNESFGNIESTEGEAREGCELSSQIHERLSSTVNSLSPTVNSPIDMRKTPENVVDSDIDDLEEPKSKRQKRYYENDEDENNSNHNNNSLHISVDEIDATDKTTDSLNNNKTPTTSSTTHTTTPKIWSVSEFLTNTTRESESSKSSPVITSQVPCLAQTALRPHCGVTLVPSPHGWIGCRVPLGYPLNPHTIPYQYALKQHLLARGIVGKPSALSSQADLLRHSTPISHSSQSSLFSPARDLDSIRNKILLEKSTPSVAI